MSEFDKRKGGGTGTLEEEDRMKNQRGEESGNRGQGGNPGQGGPLGAGSLPGGLGFPLPKL